ncbi:hypothetical protein NKG94_09710 [Micromonospora sp. M12]
MTATLVTAVTALALVAGVVTALSTGRCGPPSGCCWTCSPRRACSGSSATRVGTVWPARWRSSPCVNCSGRR